MTTGTTNFVPAELDAAQWANLQPLYQALVDRALNSADDLETFLLDRSELDAAAREAYANLYIAMTCHTEDQATKAAYLGFVENVQPHLKRVGFELDRKTATSTFAAEIGQDRYGVLLRDAQADVDLFRDENVPLQTDDTKLGQQYSELCGEMTVQFRGEERTMPQMGKFLEETDRETREQAWRGISERRMQDRDTLDGIFNQMVTLRHKIARNADCSDFREFMFKAMHRFDYTPAHCEAFHEGAEKVCMPVLHKLNEERAKALNVDQLRPWDLATDVRGRPPLRPFETVDQLVDGTSRIFHRMDDSLGSMFDSLRDGESLDLESRKGKAPGGYQECRDRCRKPFIFMNATGMQGDLETMIHEAGHAFHSILCRDEPLLEYRHSPIEFAEVASMTMELLAHPYLGEFYADEAEAARAKRTHLEDLVRLLPWVARVDAFQHWIYMHPQHTPEERTAQWLALDERFGSRVCWDGLEQFRESSWQRQLHIYEVPFYYIEYGIAQLGALQLWLQSRGDEQKAIENYRTALMLGGSKPLPQLFGAAELKFDFGPDTMGRLMDEVQSELETLPL